MLQSQLFPWVLIHFQTIPEVVDELPECIWPLGKRYDDVDEHAASVQALTLHLHHGTKWPEKHKLCEVPRAVTFKRKLINASSVSLCTSQPCDREKETLFYFF